MTSAISPIIVLGAGYMGKFHMQSLLELGISPTQILGVEPDEERRRAASEKFGITVFSSIEEFASRKPQAAIVATPSDKHRQGLEECARLGIKNVLCEKPLVLRAHELNGIQDLGLNIFVGYLINFSPLVERLRAFITERELVIQQVQSTWESNWPAKGRWIGPNLEEELVHPLVTALCLIGFDTVRQTRNEISRTFVPHVPKEFRDKKRHDNDTSLGLFNMHTKERVIPVSIKSSFNAFEQRRWIDVSLISAKGHAEEDDVAEYKACLEFDLEGGKYDRLRIIHARTNIPVEGFENAPVSANKLTLQMKAALDAFMGEGVDPRLVGLEEAAAIQVELEMLS